jgi:thiamine-phosphate pyrophosphorylase
MTGQGNKRMPENQLSTIRLVRLLDANFNRSREALRVLEDAARFLLDDAALTETAKTLRHQVSATALGLPVAKGFSLHRDTPGDVGTGMTNRTEQHRAETVDVIHAAFGRLSEALRALEEYAKVLDPAAGEQFKQIRYCAYSLHTRIVRRLQPKAGLSGMRLCVRITADLCRKDWQSVAQETLAGGADCLRLHEKHLADGEWLHRARTLAELCHRQNALFLLSDRPDLAVLAGADGVHLNQDGLPVEAARRIMGPAAIVGKDAHTPAQALAATDEGADCLAVGPMFATDASVQDQGVGPDMLRQVAATVKVPLMAAGGITPENARQTLAAGAQALIVGQAIIGQSDPKTATIAFRDLAMMR